MPVGAEAGAVITEVALGTDGSEAGLEAGIADSVGTTTAVGLDGSVSGFLLQPEIMNAAAKVTPIDNEMVLDNRVSRCDGGFISSSLKSDGVGMHIWCGNIDFDKSGVSAVSVTVNAYKWRDSNCPIDGARHVGVPPTVVPAGIPFSQETISIPEALSNAMRR